MPATRATLLCQYRYDALDRLTGQGLTDAPPLQRFYCKSRLATEIQGALRQTLFQHGDWLLAQQQQQGVEHATTLLAIDQQRSVLNTLKANHQAQPIAYAPYGHRQATNGWMSLMGFNGERPDPLTGHYLLGNGYRAFNPVLMRFNSPDSLSPFGKGGLNSYAYCAGDPVNFSDPTGHFNPIKIMAITATSITTQVADFAPAVHYIRPGISTGRAINAIKQMDELIYASSHIPYQNTAYINDLKIARDNSLNLKKITIKNLQKNSYPITELPLTPELKAAASKNDPSAARHTLLEYIDINKYGATPDEPGPIAWRKLNAARRGEFDSTTPISNRPKPTVADDYFSEINNVKNPNHDAIMKQVREIRRTHFY